MRVDYAFVAEAADSQGGLFYVTRGGADLHFLPRDFPRPLRIGAISFVVRVVGERDEVGRSFSVSYRIVDAGGRTVGFDQHVETRFEAHPIDASRATASVMAFRFYGFPVPEFGTYSFEIHHGDDRLAQVPFWVVPVDPGQAPPAAGTDDATTPTPQTGYL